MESELAAAWDTVHAATPAGWFVGWPAFEGHRGVPWSIYAFDTTERPKVGHRSREWTAVGMNELDLSAPDGALSAGDQRGTGAEVT